jgi:hypothetical protein
MSPAEAFPLHFGEQKVTNPSCWFIGFRKMSTGVSICALLKAGLGPDQDGDSISPE